ncbi:uncharacterized mitochondrial protein AtMg00710-like [Salvia splendens]|uniref:uncharacterized mitochondrial protein AtMg00710-like n=1 Tax=Salvia splendens TaxID=180675 RepID=UPI001C28139D|nr:uncharacterized mitochondrial protein AtMg00710-like [Salvia splendens]
MLIASGMEKRFWVEAVATAVKLINKCPSSSIGGDTPNLRWYGSYGDYTQLRAFGCKAFAYLKQTKLDARAQKCVMLGDQQGVKGYRLWFIVPGNRKVIVSRDVTCVEEDMPFKNSEEKVQHSQKSIDVELESQSMKQVESEDVVVMSSDDEET